MQIFIYLKHPMKDFRGIDVIIRFDTIGDALVAI